MVKLIIFDLDGVLVDAKEIHYESLNKAIELGENLPDVVEELGFEKMSDDRHYNLSGFERITTEIEDELDAKGFYVKDEIDEYDEDRGWMYYYDIELKENFINEIHKISENYDLIHFLQK